MSEKKPKNYLNNADLYDELLRCQQNEVISDKLGKMFMILSQKYTNHRYFVQYPYKEDLASLGVVACCNSYMKFDPERSSNAFAFFSSVVYHAFLQQIKKEYRQKDIKDKIMVDNDLNPSYGFEERHEAERLKKEQKQIEEDEENLHDPELEEIPSDEEEEENVEQQSNTTS